MNGHFFVSGTEQSAGLGRQIMSRVLYVDNFITWRDDFIFV